MKKIVLIILVLIWIIGLIILIIALTDLVPNSIFKQYRMDVGIGFITLTGLIKPIYRKLIK